MCVGLCNDVMLPSPLGMVAVRDMWALMADKLLEAIEMEPDAEIRTVMMESLCKVAFVWGRRAEGCHVQCSMWGRRAEGVVCSVACGEGGLKVSCAV